MTVGMQQSSRELLAATCPLENETHSTRISESNSNPSRAGEENTKDVQSPRQGHGDDHHRCHTGRSNETEEVMEKNPLRANNRTPSKCFDSNQPLGPPFHYGGCASRHCNFSSTGSPYAASMKSLVPLHISLDTGDYKIPVGLYGVGDWTNDVKVDKVHVSLE
ncbi:hypothetical protein DL95DRAFT_393576 [Leptodontidium sp. 2 PMI_412]|nr:hypothetical protein DL95DRAFT_393576 [Leptodontidium sp. 2 PMI_412]